MEEPSTYQPKERSRRSKLFETASLILVWIALSMYEEVNGPTLIDMKFKLNTDYESIATAVAGRTIGLFPGSIIGGLLVDRFPRHLHLMIAVVLNIAAVCTAAIPFSANTTVMWALIFVCGAMESVINISGTRLMLNLWLDKAVSPLMLMHFGYGVGSFLVPLYANPFLADDLPDEDEEKAAEAARAAAALNGTDSSTLGPIVYNDVTKVQFAYWISASGVVLISLIFYFYQFRYSCCDQDSNDADSVKQVKSIEKAKDEDKKNKKSFIQAINPATCAGGRFWYGVQILAVSFFYFGDVSGGDRMLGSFIRSYSIDQFDFSKDMASYLNTGFWIGFAAGRLIFSILGQFISVKILIIIDNAGMCVSGILLVIFAMDNEIALWVLLIAFGFFAAPAWPIGIAWTEYHIELTGMAMTLQILGASFGGLIHLRVIGYLYDHYGPKAFIYQTLFYGVFQLVLALLYTLIGAQHGSRRQNEDEMDDVSIEVGAEEKDEKVENNSSTKL